MPPSFNQAVLPQDARRPETPSWQAPPPDDLPYSLPLEMVVTDRDVVAALAQYAEGPARNQYAAAALKVGVLALRHVGGQVSADAIQRESSRLVENMRQTLQQHAELAQEKLSCSLKEYFDPDSGRLQERVQRLVSQDGELSQLLKGQLDGENSQLARTLIAHVGRESPLMKQLDPQESEGLLAVLRETVEAQLAEQRDVVLKEFTLDNREGALSRLVSELTTQHGDLTQELQDKIDDVVKEFSLDQENSALSRLFRNVDRAQRTITSEFSLDNEQSAFSRLKEMLETTQGAINENLTLDDERSPLARLKRELLELLGAAERKNQLFQEEVKVSLGKLVATRAEAERSTRHGIAFEDAVYEFLAGEAQQAGDVCTATGHTTGLIKNSKVGDAVWELGPDSAASGARIVIEAKEKAQYALADARREMETARKNRDADMGVFVFSTKTAPRGLDHFARYGHDMVVIWDAEDRGTDVFLQAGIATARALAFRAAQSSQAQSADFEAINGAILDIEKRAENLDQIRKSAETIHSSSTKILDRVRKDREALEKQVAILRERVDDLKSLRPA